MTPPDDSQLDALAALVGLDIAPAHRAGTLDNLQRIAALAALYMDYPLPADVEVAPVFSPSFGDD